MACLLYLDRVTIQINHRTILQNISLRLNRGECTAIVGSSGSGKSSLALSILGLIPPYSGTITFYTPAGMHQAKRSQMIWQDIQGCLNPSLSVRNILAESLHIMGGYSSQEQLLAIHEVLQAVNLPLNVLNLKPKKLSGGQQQRIAIAKALICKPELLICDEPLSALDSLNQSIILDLFNHIKKTTSSTLLFITHDIAAAYALADRIIVLDEGKIVEDAEKKEIFSNPKHPQTQNLLEAIPSFSLYDAHKEKNSQMALC